MRFFKLPDPVGIAIGAVLFAMSLTPGLLPRTWVMQGILCGISFSIGYAIGLFFHWLWIFMQLPTVRPRTMRVVRNGICIISLIAALVFLWQAAGWQNSIRVLMELPPLDSSHPVRTGLLAAGVIVVLISLGRLFRLVMRFAAARSARFLPRRVANVLGVALALLVSWLAVSGLLFDVGLRMADSSLRKVDALIEPDVARPSDPLKTGSAASLIAWEQLGRRGREYVATGPSAQEISAFTGSAAKEPLRVYAGLNSAETASERAQLALKELQRSGGFERSVLVIAVPTGTGWMDPEAMDTLEYLHRGDVATVAVQYSYLLSWLSLLVEPDYGTETGRALFEAVYGYWTTLPKESRPRLYLFGLSLGALSSQKSSDLYDIIADPFDGALWSGPPFSSPAWQMFTRGRIPSSPAWLPRFRDSSVIRFASQYRTAHMPGVEWGPLRIVYLQYASDPITFFSVHTLYSRPEWLSGQRGPDVSPSLRWFPVVTFLQLVLDMAVAGDAPLGYGHVYAPQHYIDAWLEVTAPQGWSQPDIDRLKAHFSDEQ